MTVGVRYLQRFEFQRIHHIGLLAGHLDDIVSSNDGGRGKVEIAEDNLVPHIAWGTSNEESPFGVQAGKRIKVHIGFAHRLNYSGNDFKVIKHIAVMGATIANL